MSKRSIFIGLLLLFLTPSSLFAVEEIKTGYDLYHSINLAENPTSPDDIYAISRAYGYLRGFLDGLVLMQRLQYEKMFPSNMLSEKERERISKQLNFNRLDLPKEGIATGQFILIYKRFAEKHPEKLNESARVCLFGAIVEAYGWK